MTDHLQNSIRVASHLSEKRGIYQMIFSWMDGNDERKRKSLSTGLPVKGNKKRAEEMLSLRRRELEHSLIAQPGLEEIQFADYMENWLNEIRDSVRLDTFGGYQLNVKAKIAPYFRKRGILLRNLTAEHVNKFYTEMLKSVKATTVMQYHANIIKALRSVKKFEVIEGIKRPKTEAFRGKYLKQSEVVRMFREVEGHKLELGVILGAFYGLRRSEILGLRWDAIDFDAGTISIEHTVIPAYVDGKCLEIVDDTTKSAASRRTLPLVPSFSAKLSAVREEQRRNRQLYGNSYNKKEAQYVYTDPLGNRVKPSYLSKQFPKWLEENGFKAMRFHDLRHSCASLLLSAGVSLKQIQEWLGHSDYGITANVYAHLEFDSKLAAANSMTWINQTPMATSRSTSNAEPPQ